MTREFTGSYGMNEVRDWFACCKCISQIRGENQVAIVAKGESVGSADIMKLDWMCFGHACDIQILGKLGQAQRGT